MKIGLGTVQFGLDYGISNRYGQTTSGEVNDILTFATKAGIELLDTAPAYGTSEKTLGQAITGLSSLKIVTKTPIVRHVPSTQELQDLVTRTFDDSLQALRVDSVYGLLVHHAEDLLQEGGERLWSVMTDLKNRGLVVKIGLSVYDQKQIDLALERFDIDLIQLPVNVLDQRLIESGHLKKLKNRGVEIHARSAFLQGLLLMDPQELPPHFNSVRELLTSFHAAVSVRRMTSTQASLGFVAGLPDIDRVICGINTLQQLEELVAGLTPLVSSEWSDFACDDPQILNPSNWIANKG